MNEVITIVRQPFGWTVQLGRVLHARMWFTAPGLDVYVCGANSVKESDTIANLAMNECDARHIPLSSLRVVGIEKKTGAHINAPDSAGKEQKRLFDDDHDTMQE